MYTQEPIPVYLRQEQYDALQALAAVRGVPLEELIRQGVDTVLAALRAPAPAPAGAALDDDPFGDLIGAFDSGVTDLAAHHDQYLIEFEEQSNRPWRRSRRWTAGNTSS